MRAAFAALICIIAIASFAGDLLFLDYLGPSIVTALPWLMFVLAGAFLVVRRAGGSIGFTGAPRQPALLGLLRMRLPGIRNARAHLLGGTHRPLARTSSTDGHNSRGPAGDVADPLRSDRSSSRQRCRGVSPAHLCQALREPVHTVQFCIASIRGRRRERVAVQLGMH